MRTALLGCAAVALAASISGCGTDPEPVLLDGLNGSGPAACALFVGTATSDSLVGRVVDEWFAAWAGQRGAEEMQADLGDLLPGRC
ncbi:hypothetical protein F4692_003832 [Nocardioides cavernae]|uniref:Uncharacterized protein n=1 Tax=Nocardioides cavernae TaxID=1921566 RepID=A0A7Y9KUI0_9ACTN|nr:hypothetical protein [Nocardioides cavernae]NYE38682.1 hypothetical protein [Nocardioides cavernae]